MKPYVQKRAAKKIQCLNSSRRIATKTKAQAIVELRSLFDLEVLLNQTNMARSSYYYHEKRHQSSDKYDVVKELIKQIYHHHKVRSGYRRITLELRKKAIVINHKSVLRLMNVRGLKRLVRVKKCKCYKGEQGRIALDVLNRDFKAIRPNEKWATDLTKFNVLGKKLYLASHRPF